MWDSNLTPASGIGRGHGMNRCFGRSVRRPIRRSRPGRSRAATRWRARTASATWSTIGRMAPVHRTASGSGSDPGRDGVEPLEAEARPEGPGRQQGGPGRRRLARTASRRRACPRTEVSTSTHSGKPGRLRPVSRPRPSSRRRRPTVTTSMHTKDVPGHRLEHGTGQIGRPVGRAQAHEGGARASSRHHGARAPSSHGTAPSPRGPGRAGGGQRGQLVGGVPSQPAEPGQEGAGRRQPALEQPAPVGRPGDDRTRPATAPGARPRGPTRWPSCPS